jgi:hypothetical protein
MAPGAERHGDLRGVGEADETHPKTGVEQERRTAPDGGDAHENAQKVRVDQAEITFQQTSQPEQSDPKNCR